MASVHNPTVDTLEVPSYGITFEPGDTFEIANDIAATLPAPPFEITGLPAAVAQAHLVGEADTSSQGSPTGIPPAAVAAPATTTTTESDATPEPVKGN